MTAPVDVPMSADLLFWLALVLKMAVSAAFVVSAAMVAERVGPAIGALIATLPIAAGPAYFFLALDHDAAFISVSVIGNGISTFLTSSSIARANSRA